VGTRDFNQAGLRCVAGLLQSALEKEKFKKGRRGNSTELEERLRKHRPYKDGDRRGDEYAGIGEPLKGEMKVRKGGRGLPGKERGVDMV